MYAQVYMCRYVYVYVCPTGMYMCMYAQVCICVCMHRYVNHVCVCIHGYVYVYVCTGSAFHTGGGKLGFPPPPQEI